MNAENPTKTLTPTERADKIMVDCYSHRWAEDPHNSQVWLAIRTALTVAVAEEREACAQIADSYDNEDLQRGSDGWKIATDIRARN